MTAKTVYYASVGSELALYDIKRDAQEDSWVVMEYVSGDSLEDVLSGVLDRGPVQPVDRVRLGGIGRAEQRGGDAGRARDRRLRLRELQRAPPGRRFRPGLRSNSPPRTNTARSLRRAVVTGARAPGLPCAQATPALYSQTVATNTLILWYTASGTFIWSKAAGCTMAPPERRLAAPWGPKLS